MKLLQVFHFTKGSYLSLTPLQENWMSHPNHPSIFYLETCQRKIWISNIENRDALSLFSNELMQNIEIFQGKNAYHFLLRLSTGLVSQIVGETEVFGQIKKAWHQFYHIHQRNEKSFDCPSSSLPVSVQPAWIPWMQKIFHNLFNDTKNIRTHYLQNLGGHSYGSLIRKLIKHQLGHFHGPILLIGAGQIAQAIAPYLVEKELWIANRDGIRLNLFYQRLVKRWGNRIKKIESVDDEREAWEKAAHIVICIPLLPEKDFNYFQWFQRGGTSHRSVTHLGGIQTHCGIWTSLQWFFSLSHLFSLQSSLVQIRSCQMIQAEKACEDRTTDRFLQETSFFSEKYADRNSRTANIHDYSLVV